MSVSGDDTDDGREQVVEKTQEKRYVLRDELREVHSPQCLHKEKLFVFVYVVPFRFPCRPEGTDGQLRQIRVCRSRMSPKSGPMHALNHTPVSFKPLGGLVNAKCFVYKSF